MNEQENNYVYLKEDRYIDLENFSFVKQGMSIHLSHTEFLILKLLCKNLRIPVSHSEIIDYVWRGYVTNRKILYVYINRIRKKIEDNPNKPKFLLAVRGYGYVLMSTYKRPELIREWNIGPKRQWRTKA